MNYVKTSPKGIDIPVAKMQIYLYNKLKVIWGLTDSTLDMYGRAYRNQTKDGYIPEMYTGVKNYSELMFNDKISASGFFGFKDNTPVSVGAGLADGFLIMMVNLDKVKPSETDRKDEEARLDVQRILLTGQFGFEVDEFVTGIDSVFSEYSGWKKVSGIKYRDMHPLHCFRINFKILIPIDGIGCVA